jgi:hypothetical protein
MGEITPHNVLDVTALEEQLAAAGCHGGALGELG